jgi:hypothetical protein
VHTPVVCAPIIETAIIGTPGVHAPIVRAHIIVSPGSGGGREEGHG